MCMETGKETQYIEMFKEYLHEQAKYMDEIRSVKHDMQAHMIVLYYYLEEARLDKAKSYLESFMSNQHFLEQPLADVGHDMINAIICSTLKRSKTPIEFQHTGVFLESVEIDDYDLCTLFFNLFSNSVEACEKLEHTQRRISLEIGQCAHALSIVMENPIENMVDETILGKSTTKEDKSSHGYGIRNVKSVVEKYNGSIEFEITKDTFRVKILFSEVVKSAYIC